MLEDEQADAFETSYADVCADDADDLIQRMSSLTLGQSNPPHQHSSKSSMFDAGLTSFRIENEGDYEDEIRGRSIRSGFAGEFFVGPCIRDLSDFPDIPEVERTPSWVFGVELDQLFKTLRGISSMS